MKIIESVFKAYDVRGLVGTELTNELAYAVGRAFSDYLEAPGPICVGYDMRPDSVELAAEVRRGLVQQGRTVIDIGEVASDMIYFAVGHLRSAGGVMVTASHNPGQYNGIKLCRENAGGVSLEHGLGEIKTAIMNDAYKSVTALGEVVSQNIMSAWVTHAMTFARGVKLPPYRIAVDAGNGMGGAVMPHLLKLWPLTVTPLYWELDGTFPNHPANPLEPANNADLARTILEQSLDFGVAFDGDGDRAFMLDESGHGLSGSTTTALLAEWFLRRNPGATILYNVNCSRVVRETIEAAGGHAVRTKVGHSNIKLAMKQYGAVFAGEHSGHYYFKDNWNADSGLIAAICAISALAESQGPLSALAARYEKYAASGELNFKVAAKDAMIQSLKKVYADGVQDELDGLAVDYPNWWFIVRASNTEPYLRLNVEATTPELLAEKLAGLTTLLTV